MNGSVIVSAVFYLVLAGALFLFACGYFWILRRYVEPFIVDVALGETGITLVILRCIRFQIIPYDRIESVEKATRWQMYMVGIHGDLAVGGVPTRGSPFVVIHRNDKRSAFVCTPKDRDGFILELRKRVALAQHDSTRGFSRGLGEQ